MNILSEIVAIGYFVVVTGTICGAMAVIMFALFMVIVKCSDLLKKWMK